MLELKHLDFTDWLLDVCVHCTTTDDGDSNADFRLLVELNGM